MKILMVSPETPKTFWSFSHAVKFVSKKSSEIPLGLITMAAILPEKWEKHLIDMNVSRLRDKDILWADFVFLSGMNVHITSIKKIISRCNDLGVKIVAGGPLATTNQQQFLGVDHFVLNEAEITLPLFLKDLEAGTPKHVYATNEYPDISKTPKPLWNLLKTKKYVSMSLQYSRGCPYNCEFCSITMLNGRKPRTKSREQFLDELTSLYNTGWRRSVFIVDDNFIGNKKKLKADILPAMIEWMEEKNRPFTFTTEASINIADDDELMDLMVKAGFYHTFIGIETPNNESLAECGKSMNLSRDIVSSVKKLQHKGFIVSGGFIVGFDNDPPDIFKQQINFIQKSGIVTAMVGLLNAPKGTKLYNRLDKENRLIGIMSGDNLDGSTNFIPKMNYQQLITGYKEILRFIYSQKNYYERVKTFLKEYSQPVINSKMPSFTDIRALFRSAWKLGIFEKGRRYYWKLLFYSLFKHPKKFPLTVTLAIYGFHFRKVVESI